MNIGTVYLVGAGPGDPDLITVKALRRIREADVVLHDRLVSLELLRETRADAIVINVGKERGTEDLQQDLIHELLIAYARDGKNVCRLKGGDPFVFGRGAEEARALAAQGIEFEVVPGITSAIAAPGAAGIAVTHRDHNHGFMVIAGIRSHAFESAEWSAARLLVKSGGTVVVLMGLGRLPQIVEYLSSGDGSRSTPAAVISNGTLDSQQTRIAPLHDIANQVDGVSSPATLIVGNVVATSLDRIATSDCVSVES